MRCDGNCAVSLSLFDISALLYLLCLWGSVKSLIVDGESGTSDAITFRPTNAMPYSAPLFEFRVIPPDFRLWTLVTGGFIETSLANVVIDVAVLMLAGSVMEPLWGFRRYFGFIMVVNVAATALAVCTCLVLYAGSGNLEWLFLRFSGLGGVMSGFTVAFAQSFPKHTIRIMRLRIEPRVSARDMVVAPQSTHPFEVCVCVAW